MYPVYLGRSIAPFRSLCPAQAVVPWNGTRLLTRGDEIIDFYPGLADWLNKSESSWIQYRSSKRLSLAERLDYRNGLSLQFPVPQYRVVYPKSGMYLASALVTNQDVIIDHELYWGSVDSLDEGRFLTAIFNSNVLTLAVRHLQSHGAYGPRHFDKYIFQLPIPLYDPNDEQHQRLVSLAERAERVAANVELPDVRFEKQRRIIREALVDDGVAAEMESIVKLLLQ